MPDLRTQAVTGVEPPEIGEARIRERWPSVARFTGLANLGRILNGTIVLAPLSWLLLAPFYFGKLAPIVGRRYTLTNKRIMIRAGWSAKPKHAVALADIDDVRIQTDANSQFYRAGTVEIVSGGTVALSLKGTPEPDNFAAAILNARNAWVPEKAKTLPFIPASTP
jgi:hypothetical protein